MARFTSIGMPRKTFVASTAEEASTAQHAGETTQSQGSTTTDEPAAPKKKVHRSGKRLKKKLQRQEAIAKGEMEPPVPTPLKERAEGDMRKMHKRKRAEEREREENGWGSTQGNWNATGSNAGGAKRARGWGRDEGIAKEADKTEQRRIQRIDERTSSTTCFACRGIGHSARECPNIEAPSASTSASTAAAKSTSSICYRCGSTSHSLSHCRKPEHPTDPTPYATCYVCSQSGHLSAQCPKNDKGVYVNGGKCKICGSVRHRAGDCPELKRVVKVDEEGGAGASPFVKTGPVGADEDDFMLESRERLRAPVQGGKGKMEKKAFNNNGLRRPYKEAEAGAAVGSTGDDDAGVTPTIAVKPKQKAKVVAF